MPPDVTEDEHCQPSVDLLEALALADALDALLYRHATILALHHDPRAGEFEAKRVAAKQALADAFHGGF